ncbi:MAG: hypothetical protein M3440_01085 [Chloroflexota bacterium]|nr:hypothetical protein [Chloroflexota bacterium]
MRHQADHSIGQIDWHRTWRHVQGIVVFVAIIAGLVLLTGWLGRPPQTQAAAEGQLERPVMAFQMWDGTPYVVFEFGDSGHVYFDRLRIDWISIEWPPTPRWQWTGFWSYIDTTTAPASAGLTVAAGGSVVFGQVNTPEIVTLELEIDGAWRSYPVSGPGYAVRLSGYDETPTGYRWLDAGGRVILSVDEPSSLQP